MVVKLSGCVFPINAFGVAEGIREGGFSDRFEASVDALFGVRSQHEAAV